MTQFEIPAQMARIWRVDACASVGSCGECFGLKMRTLFRCFLVLLLGVCCSGLAAETKGETKIDPTKSKQLALDGKRIWAAFHAAAFAGVAEREDLANKLMAIGVNSGRKFFAAVEAKEIAEEDMKTVPIGVLIRAQGPSHDFILGRIWEGAVEEAFDKLKINGNPMSKDEMKRVAENELRKANAELLAEAP